MELKAFYENSYTWGGDDGELYAEWRALSAVGKADHVLTLTPMSLRARKTRVLDVGCGDGALITELARRRPDWEFAGVEIADAAVAIAAARCPDADVRGYDGRTLPWAPGTFDLTIVSHVLEHVSDPVALLAQAASVAPCVIVEVPLEDNVSARRAAKRTVAADVGHIQRFSRRSVARVAEEAGVRVTAEIVDALGREVHTFFARTRTQRALATAKWLVRDAINSVASGLAQRLFTVHYACRCEPAAASTAP